MKLSKEIVGLKCRDGHSFFEQTRMFVKKGDCSEKKQWTNEMDGAEKRKKISFFLINNLKSFEQT